MAEGDVLGYNNFKEQLLLAGIDLANDTLKLALVSGYTQDIDLDQNWDDVSANEISGSGYTAGGETVANPTVTQDDTNDRGEFDADDVTWTALDAGTPSHAILYKDTGTPSTSPLIFAMEIETASNGGDYTVQFGTPVLYLS